MNEMDLNEAPFGVFNNHHPTIARKDEHSHLDNTQNGWQTTPSVPILITTKNINDCQQQASLHKIVIIWKRVSSDSAATTDVLNICALE